jgi:hypothetical protein
MALSEFFRKQYPWAISAMAVAQSVLVVFFGNYLHYVKSVDSYRTYRSLELALGSAPHYEALIMACIVIDIALLIMGLMFSRNIAMRLAPAFFLVLAGCLLAVLYLMPDFMQKGFVREVTTVLDNKNGNYLYNFQAPKRGLLIGHILRVKEFGILLVDIDDGKWVLTTEQIVKQSFVDYGKAGQCVRVFGRYQKEGLMKVFSLLPCPYDFTPSWIKRPMCHY